MKTTQVLLNFVRGLRRLYYEVSNFTQNVLLSSNKFHGVSRHCNKIRTRGTTPLVTGTTFLSAMVYLQQGAVPLVVNPSSFQMSPPISRIFHGGRAGIFTPFAGERTATTPSHRSRFLDFSSVRFRGTFAVVR